MLVEIGNDYTYLWPLALGLLLLLLIIVWLWQRRFSYVLCMALFGIYLLFAIELTLFPIRTTDPIHYRSIRQILAQINWTPLDFDFTYLSSIVRRQIIQNVLLTIPFGFGINFILPIRARYMLLIIPLVGISFEATQLAIGLNLHYLYRIVDINDVILNALGVLIGYMLFRIFAWVYAPLTRLLRVHQWGLLGYFYQVVRRA